jgi:hypothetical protein
MHIRTIMLVVAFFNNGKFPKIRYYGDIKQALRKGIRFSKSHEMHRIVIGLIINFWFFGRKVW